jgi:hypothetical protein
VVKATMATSIIARPGAAWRPRCGWCWAVPPGGAGGPRRLTRGRHRSDGGLHSAFGSSGTMVRPAKPAPGCNRHRRGIAEWQDSFSIPSGSLERARNARASLHDTESSRGWLWTVATARWSSGCGGDRGRVVKTADRCRRRYALGEPDVDRSTEVRRSLASGTRRASHRRNKKRTPTSLPRRHWSASPIGSAGLQPPVFSPTL